MTGSYPAACRCSASTSARPASSSTTSTRPLAPPRGPPAAPSLRQVLGPDPAPMRLDDSPADVQSQSQPHPGSPVRPAALAPAVRRLRRLHRLAPVRSRRAALDTIILCEDEFKR